LNEAIFLSSVNPAKQLGVFDEVGSITPGKWADLVVIDESYRVVMTLCRGEIAYNED
jgi:N-acetylglucosamine-6-phosphate deacetylase